MFTQSIKSLMNTSQSNSLKAGPEAGAGPAGKEGESYPCGRTIATKKKEYVLNKYDLWADIQIRFSVL